MVWPVWSLKDNSLRLEEEEEPVILAVGVIGAGDDKAEDPTSHVPRYAFIPFSFHDVNRFMAAQCGQPFLAN